MSDKTPLEDFLAAVDSHLKRVRAKGREAVELFISGSEIERCGARDEDETVFGIPIMRMNFIRDGLAVLGLDDGSRYEFELPAPRHAPSGRTPLEEAEAFLELVEGARQPFVWIGKAWGASGDETYLTHAAVKALVAQIRFDDRRIRKLMARTELLESAILAADDMASGMYVEGGSELLTEVAAELQSQRELRRT